MEVPGVRALRDAASEALTPLHPRRRPARPEEAGEGLMSACNVALAASCGVHLGAVSDDPAGGAAGGVAACRDGTGPPVFGGTWHASIICLR